MSTGLRLRITNTTNDSSADRTFPQFPVRIGRSTLNDLNILDRFVSQFHAVVELHGSELMLRDLGSSNGTRVGSNRAPPHQPVPLASHEGSFSIGPLVFQASLTEIKEDPEHAPMTRRLGASGSEAPPAAAQGSSPPGAAADDDDSPVLEDSVVTNLHATLVFDDPAVAEARKRFAALQGEPNKDSPEKDPRKAGLGKTLLLDQDVVARQRAAAIARIKPPTGGGFAQGADAKQRKLEQLALQGVREIAKALLPSASAIEEPEDLVRFLSKLRDTIEVFLRCFIPLRDGYRQFASQMHIQRGHGLGSVVETATDEVELALALLDWKGNGREPLKAVESTFADLMIHQLALLHAIMRGVKSLLDALSPKAIDLALQELAKQNKANFSWGPWRFKELWRLYGAKHGDMDDGDKRMFAALFGPDFAESYKQYRGTVDNSES